MSTTLISQDLLGSGYRRLLAADIPAPTGIQPPGTEGLTTILGWIAWGVTFLCVVGVFLVAGKMAFSHRRGEGSEAVDDPRRLVAVTVKR